MDATWKRIAATAATMLLCASAHATLVTQWDYSLLTRFSGDNTFTATGFPTQTETETQVAWGDPSGDVFAAGSSRSGITLSDADTVPGGDDPVADPITGRVVTNGTTLSDIGLGGWITHHNNIVSSMYATLVTSEIESTLTLTPYTPPIGGQVGPSTLAFTVHFVETPNGEPCVAASPVGNPCNDIFALNESEAFNQSFAFDGQTYFINIFPLIGDSASAFPLLSSAQCAAAGANDGCVGFTTVEGRDTTIRFGFSITSDPVNAQLTVPEPGSLALIVLALASASLLSRRRGDLRMR